MNIVRLLMIGVLISVSALLLERPKGFSVLLLIAGAVSVLVFGLTRVQSVMDFLQTLESKTGLSSGYLAIVYKVIGICILGEFSVSVCADNHHQTLGKALEFACKCSVLALALPIFQDVLKVIGELLQ